MILTLIGYRGTGKSSVAPMLAEQIGWDWIDADTEIERTAGVTIREIFDRGGESEFRRLERGVIEKLLSRERTVVAAGGGAILDVQTRNEIKSAGPVVWLQAGIETITERLLNDPATGQRRPSLTDRDEEEEIRFLLALREPIYRDTASHTVETDGKDLQQIADEVFSFVGEQLNGSQNDSF